MAFLETRGERQVIQGVCPVKIVLEAAVYAGDPIGISTTPGWVPSIDAAVEQPVLIAGEDGKAGEEITAYMMAVVKVTHTNTNKATLGEKVAVKDTGEYQAASANLPDVGFVAQVDPTSGASVWSILFLNPTAAQITVVRA